MTRCALLLLLISPLLLANTYPPADFSTPRSTMKYFLKTMKGHKLGDTEALDLAIKALNTSKLDEATQLDSSRLAAQQLINTLDRLEYIKIENIPLSVEGNRWVYARRKVSNFERNEEVEISMTQTQDQKWLFSPRTLETIALFERSVRSNEVAKGVTELINWKTKLKSQMPEWTGHKSFLIYNGQWLGIFSILLACILILVIIRSLTRAVLQKALHREHIPFEELKIESFATPIGFLMSTLVWLGLIRLLEFPDNILAFLLRAGYVAFTIGSIVSLYKFVDVFCLYLEDKARESESKFDDIFVPLVRKASKFIVVCLGIVLIGHSLTFDMKSIIAGMGIGGIAFALAAKDTISNLFGSITVLLDQPFAIGDWVVIDGKIEGTVEEVGMRSTRVRTFYDSLISVPNGQLTNAHVDNYGRRTYRRYNTKLGVQYDTPPEKIEAFCEGIRKIILEHPHTRKDYFHVYFNGFNNSSLDILLYVFWSVPDWSRELEEKQRLLLAILSLGNEMGINFAFPTQTVHLFNETMTN